MANRDSVSSKGNSALKASDKVKIIKALYIYVMLAVSVFMLIFGGFRGVRTVLNLAVLDEYPVEGEEYRCSGYDIGPVAAEEDTTVESTQDQYKRCLAETNNLRKKTLVQDVSDSFSYLAVGSLVAAVHYKLSKALNSSSK